jgi:hypothetical protein
MSGSERNGSVAWEEFRGPFALSSREPQRFSKERFGGNKWAANHRMNDSRKEGFKALFAGRFKERCVRTRSQCLICAGRLLT